MIGDALAIVGANACVFVAGAGLLRFAGGWRSLSDLPRRLGLAYMTGFAAVGVAAPLLLIAGASLALWQVLVLCGLLAALGLLPVGSPPQGSRRRSEALEVILPLAVASAAFLVLLAVDLVHQPLWAADAWQQWTPKARSVVALHGLEPRFLAGVLNSDYPFLLPAIEAIDFRFMGIDTVVIHLQFWFVVVGLVVALRDLLADRVRSLLLWPVLAAITFSPALGIHSAYAVADIPLATFVALAGVCGWRWLEFRRPSDLGLLGLFLAATFATKAEGSLYACALIVVLVMLAARESLRLAGVTLATGAIAAAVGIVAWRIWAGAYDLRDYYSTRASLGDLPDRIDRVPVSVATLAREIFDPTSWLSLAPLAAAAAVLAWRAGRDRRTPVLLLGTSAIVFAGLVWIYWTSAFEVHTHLAQSARRVIDGIVLLGAALTPPLLASVLDPGDQREATTAGSGGE